MIALLHYLLTNVWKVMHDYCLCSPAAAQVAVRADQAILQQPVEILAGITLHHTYT